MTHDPRIMLIKGFGKTKTRMSEELIEQSLDIDVPRRFKDIVLNVTVHALDFIDQEMDNELNGIGKEDGDKLGESVLLLAQQLTTNFAFIIAYAIALVAKYNLEDRQAVTETFLTILREELTVHNKQFLAQQNDSFERVKEKSAKFMEALGLSPEEAEKYVDLAVKFHKNEISNEEGVKLFDDLRKMEKKVKWL